MDNFCIVLAHHALLGEVARAKGLLGQTAANCLTPEMRRILDCCFGLALGSGGDYLSQLHSVEGYNYQHVSEVVEMLYLSSLAIKEVDKIEAMTESIRMEAGSMSPQMLMIAFVACCVFDVSKFGSLFDGQGLQDGDIDAMFCISELLGQQNQQRVEKYYKPSPDGSAFNYYMELVKKLTDQESPVPALQTMRIRAPMVAQALRDGASMLEIPFGEKFQLLQYVNNQRAGMRLHEYARKQFQNPFNALLMELALGNFPSEAEAIVEIQSFLDQVVPKIVGKPTLQSQRDRVTSLLLQIARAFPAPACLRCLREYIADQLEPRRNRQLDLLLAYFEGAEAYLTKNAELAKASAERFGEIFQRGQDTQLSGLENFAMRTDDIYLLVQALQGKHKEVKSQLQDNVQDDQEEEAVMPCVRVLVEDLESPLLANNLTNALLCLSGLHNRLQRRRANGYGGQIVDIGFGYVLPDGVALACLCQLIVEKIQLSQTLDTELLGGAREALDEAHAIWIGSGEVRFARQLVYNNLQMFDAMLRDVSDISAFASGENNIAISTRELILAASAAAQMYKHDEASTYAGQALVMDPGVDKSPEYSSVVAKILSAKGLYSEAYKKLGAVLEGMIHKSKGGDSLKNTELVPLRIHIAMLKIRAGELSGFLDLRQLQQHFPPQQAIQIEMDPSSGDFLGMHIAVERAKAVLYLLRRAGVFNSVSGQGGAKGPEMQQSSFEQILQENALLFFESPALLEKFSEFLVNTFSQGKTIVGAKYIGARYGPPAIQPALDVFGGAAEAPVPEIQQFVQQQKITIQTAVSLLKPYLQFSLDATELLSQVHLVLLNDKVGYVQCFNQLTKAVPSTTRLAALAGAHLAVGNAKQAQEYYLKAAQAAKDVITATKLPEFVQTLITICLQVLRSRALTRCHRYKECEELLEKQLQEQQLAQISAQADAETKMNGEAHQISFTMAVVESIRLKIKLRQYDGLLKLCNDVIERAVKEFNLPNDFTRGVSANTAPLSVAYAAVYAARAKAELIHQNQVVLPREERLELLNKAVFWSESNVVLKTQRVLPGKIDVSMRMSQSVFSTQQSVIALNVDQKDVKFNDRERIGLKGLVLAAEISVELAELFLDQAGVDYRTIQEQAVVLTADKKAALLQAYEHAKQSLRIPSARGLNVCAIYQLLAEQNLEQARQHALRAREIEPFNSTAQQLISVISHRMNFAQDGDEEVESEKANTPFEDATRLLQTGLNVDRVHALDNFLLNSCLVHDMTVVTRALFDKEDQMELLASDQIIGQDFQSLEDLNARSDRVIGTNYDGYYYLGRGFLSVKMGRIQAGFKDLLGAVNSQTLSDRYRVRALFLLACLYLNPSRAPLFGFQSCLSGGQRLQSLKQKQKDADAAMNVENTQPVKDEVQLVDNEDVQVLDNETINQKEEDIQEAVQALNTMEDFVQKNVPEAAELSACIQALIRVSQYQLTKAKMARAASDESKAKAKMAQLEALKEESKGLMLESTEEVGEKLNTIERNQPNYVILHYVIGVLFTHLKNDAKAKLSFQTGAKQITSIKEVGQSGQSNQSQLWLDVDAAVLCNLSLADSYVSGDKINAAIKVLDAVASLDKIQAIAYELYGLCMEKENVFEDAVQYYESAWLLSKGSPSVAYRLAYNYIKASRYQDAILMCQAALNEWPNFYKLKNEVLFKAEQQLRSQLGHDKQLITPQLPSGPAGAAGTAPLKK